MMISMNVSLWSCSNTGQCGQAFTVSVSCAALSDFTRSWMTSDTRKARDCQDYCLSFMHVHTACICSELICRW